MPKLTKRAVEAVEPKLKGDVFLWDTELPGFGLRVYPSGTRKYLFQYRTKERRQRRAVLGRHGPLTVEQARVMAREMLVQVHRGGDPAGELRAARKAPKVCDLADDYLERHAIPNKRPDSVADDRSMLDRIILPRLGRIKVAAVTRRDIEPLHNTLRKTPYNANRVLALMSKMFSLAVAWRWRADNPVRGIPRFHEDRRERWLSNDELARLWAVLEQHPNRRAANAVTLMILTGARRNEVLGATWDQFDLERAVWTKPSHHTKQKKTEHVPLSAQALALLSAMKQEADADCPYPFPGDAPGKPLGEIKRFWMRVRHDAGIEGVRLHDLRHTYASSLVSRGVSLHIVGRLLGHTQPQTTARYADIADEALREATDRLGSTPDAAIDDAEQCYQATVQGSNITPDLAIHYCTRAIQSGELSDHNLAVTFNNRGIVYFNKGESDRAIRDYDQVIRLDPDYAYALINRAAAYENKGEYDRAIRDYDQVIRLDPDLAFAYENRGLAYEHLGQIDAAIRDYSKQYDLGSRPQWLVEKLEKHGALQ